MIVEIYINISNILTTSTELQNNFNEYCCRLYQCPQQQLLGTTGPKNVLELNQNYRRRELTVFRTVQCCRNRSYRCTRTTDTLGAVRLIRLRWNYCGRRRFDFVSGVITIIFGMKKYSFVSRLST